MNTGSTQHPLRVGIACYPTPEGSGVLATELGLALADRGHEVHFLAYSRPPRLTRYHPRVFCHLVQVSTYPLFKYPPYDLALAAKMAEVVEEHRLDVVHVHYAVPHSISAFLARQLLPGRRLGIVTTLHGTDITLVGDDRSYRNVIRFGIETSDVVIAVSEFLQRETLRLFGSSRHIEVVPNFVDTQRFRPRTSGPPQVPDVPEGHKIVLHATNFRPVKRSGDAVRAFAQAARGKPVSLLMVGDGPDRESCSDLLGDLGIKSQVQFLGTVDDLSDLLPGADLFLPTSEAETFALQALEAHACGVPVVAFDIGGMNEVVQDGKTGFLVSDGDLPALAGRIATVLGDAALGAEFAARGRARAVADFDLAKILAIHEDLYTRALEASTTASP